MKKIGPIISLVILVMCLLAPLPSQAAETCVWRMQQTVSLGMTSTQTGGCISNERAIIDETQIPNKCTTTKPQAGLVAGGYETARCCCSTPAPVVTPEAPKFVMPQWQVKIPTVNLTEPNCSLKEDGTYYCEVPWLGQYIVGLYNYGLSVAGILAAIMLMAGGVIWLISGGDASKVGQAKELIIGSITGLVILSASYILLTQINPELANFKPLGIGVIGSIPLPEDTAAFSANCTPQTSGNCSVSNMTQFGDKASEASAICNAESGGNAEIYNALTKCTGGEYAVWGLFQFNLSDNGDFIDAGGTSLNCRKAFNKAWTNKSPSCTVVDTALYNKCVTAAKDPAVSIKNAYRLKAAAHNTWGPWEANAKWCHFK